MILPFFLCETLSRRTTKPDLLKVALPFRDSPLYVLFTRYMLQNLESKYFDSDHSNFCTRYENVAMVRLGIPFWFARACVFLLVFASG